MRNLRLAFRTLFRTPLVTLVAVLSLALGIGANAAIFSLFDQILLQPLPVPQPDQLVNLGAPGPKPGSQSCNQAGDCEQVFSYAMFRDLEASQTSFTGLAAHRIFGVNLAREGQTLNASGMLVSGSYFPLLGVQPALGRLFAPADDATIGGHFVAVLSHAYWENSLGGDRDVIGSAIVVNGQAMTVIGVAPRGFTGTTLGVQPAVYAPLTMRAQMSPGWEGHENRRDYWAYVFGRLRTGVSIEQAAAATNGLYRPIINDVEAALQTGMSDAGMERFRDRELTMADGRRGQSSVHEESKTPLLLLFATAAIVLLIACANVANLLLARGASRGMEMAVRLSLGATRRQVLGQLLTESLVLAALGGVASLFVARWTLLGVGSILPPEAATMLRLELQLPVVAFAAVLSMATGLVFGMFPALHSTRPDLVTTIRSSAGNLTVTKRAARFRTALVTAQIALSMALLITAGLFLRSLANISRVDLGLEPQNVIAFAVSPVLNGYDAPRAKLVFERLEQELAALPEVAGVTAALVPVLAGNNWGTDVHVEGFERGPDINSNSRLNSVGPGYFATLGMPLLAGREFTASDDFGREKVVVVNEAFLRKFGLGQDAVGKRMAYDGDELDTEIVGVVRDARYSDVKTDVPPLFFSPWRQQERVGTLTFYVRTTGDPARLLRAIPAAVARVDPNLPVEELKTLPQQVRENVALDRMIGTLAASFAALATLLATVGLYGMLAYTVARRTREIGVRMALGASHAVVRGMVLRQVVVLLIIGGVIGIAGALALGHVRRHCCSASRDATRRCSSRRRCCSPRSRSARPRSRRGARRAWNRSPHCATTSPRGLACAPM